MRRGLILACVALTGCLHFDRAALESWALAKAERVAECAATSLLTQADVDRCLGECVADLGTKAGGEAAELRGSVMQAGVP